MNEMGEMPISLQPKLLRALQERKVRPIGSDKEIPFEVRIMSATNKNLENLVSYGQFREDLFYRLNVIEIDVPPLRERIGDAHALAQHYVEHFARINDKAIVGLTHEAVAKLNDYPWPGNVRELQNSIERAVALTKNRELGVEDFSEKIKNFKIRVDHI